MQSPSSQSAVISCAGWRAIAVEDAKRTSETFDLEAMGEDVWQRGGRGFI